MQKPLISLMLAVPNARAAIEWYKTALGAPVLESGFGRRHGARGRGLLSRRADGEIWQNPQALGPTTARVEVFCDDPDAIIRRALEAGAKGDLKDLRDHGRPWGVHRQGLFTDPFGRIWFVGDRTPLASFPT